MKQHDLAQYKNDWVEQLKQYVIEHVGENLEGIAVAITGIFLLIAILFIFDFIIKKILLYATSKVINLTSFKWDNLLFEHRVFNSIYHLIPLIIAHQIAPYVLYPTPWILNQIDKVIVILFVLVFLQLFFRISNALVAIATDENNYRTIAVRTFGQLIKIVMIFFSVLIIISILFDIQLKTILTTLGAATAILLLVFRDTILGFVSGVQISSSKMVKVGDWIRVPKYDLEGVVREINLISAKIENFDKTISSIPTYELISTEVKNYEAMTQTQTRRIKRSIVFGLKSFQFCDKAMLEKLKTIDLIRDYIQNAENEFEAYNEPETSTDQQLINNRRLTNIGLFRYYTLNYLKNHPEISQTDTLMVRQLEITPHGMPLEVYCFTKTSKWLEYENIQADIFDHLTTACKEFDLEVMQILTA